MTRRTLSAALDALCAELVSDLGLAYAARASAARERLHGPIRIAVTGRVKAGKSTLLNALVGERLAPTDAGELTRVVSWYRHAHAYDVRAHMPGGAMVAVPFRKGDEAIEIDLSAIQGELEELEIGWPSGRLRAATLVDTPGLGSLVPALGEKTRSLLAVDGPGASQVDAVVYLMRHAHHEDAAFLEGFRDAGLPMSSPINTVAVLSRADEIGGGRLGALDSADKIARRYARDPRIRTLAGTVVAVAGLLGETGTTLEEAEFAALRQVAALGDGAGELLLSVDRFRNPDANPLSSELRERLLARFGLFGLRYSVYLIREQQAPTAQELANRLVGRSGLNVLRDVITERFTSRGSRLVARSVLLDLKALARDMAPDAPSAAHNLKHALEELEAGAHELAELDLLHRIGIDDVRLNEDERAEVERLVGAIGVNSRLGVEPDSPPAVLQAAALAGIARWRERAANPLTDRTTAQACETVSRTYEGIYVEVT